MKECHIGIVGGCGFVGSSLAEYFSHSFKVRLLDLKPPRGKVKSNVEFVQCDIRNNDEVRRKLRGLEVIIHTAIVQLPFINGHRRQGYEVNVLGLQNVCETVKESKSIKGLILASSWHVWGDNGFQGVIDEEYGFRPDKLEDRAKYYALTKMAQETIVRIFDRMSDKVYGIIRMGTVLGKRMPEKTAASIFITEALLGKPVTPYKHSLYRPMFYVDINDVCHAYYSYANEIRNNKVNETQNSLGHTFNLAYPKSLTIFDLAMIVKNTIERLSHGRIVPKIEIIDAGLPVFPKYEQKESVNLNLTKIKKFFQIPKITNPKESVERIVADKLSIRHMALGNGK